jgi:hypothetical protein
VRVLRTLLFFFIFAAGILGQPPQAAEIGLFESMYLAKDDGTGKAGQATNDFSTTDRPIYCVVVLSGASPVNVRMNLVAVAVPGVKPDKKVVSTSYTTKDMQDRVNFSGKPEKLWVAGKYRAEIFINDILVKKLDFDIREATAAAMKPALGFQPKRPAKAVSIPPKRNK